MNRKAITAIAISVTTALSVVIAMIVRLKKKVINIGKSAGKTC